MGELRSKACADRSVLNPQCPLKEQQASAARGKAMAAEAGISDVITNQDAVSEERIWQAVIVSTIHEWMSGPERRSREAEQFLFRDENDFSLVCLSAGMDPQRLRERLVRLRDKLAIRPDSNLPRNECVRIGVS
jgi:hypothetical protein